MKYGEMYVRKEVSNEKKIYRGIEKSNNYASSGTTCSAHYPSHNSRLL